MKNLIMSLFAAAVLLMIGCQDSVTDPIAIEQVDKSQIEIPENLLHGIIPLEGLLMDPNHVGNSYYQISGQIKYNYRIFYMDPLPPALQRSLSVHFETNADLQYFCTVCPQSEQDVLAGFITDVTDAIVPLGGNSVLVYEKSFPIQGTEKGLVLKVRFLITYSLIEVNAMWLALPNPNAVATDINQY